MGSTQEVPHLFLHCGPFNNIVVDRPFAGGGGHWAKLHISGLTSHHVLMKYYVGRFLRYPPNKQTHGTKTIDLLSQWGNKKHEATKYIFKAVHSLLTGLLMSCCWCTFMVWKKDSHQTLFKHSYSMCGAQYADASCGFVQLDMSGAAAAHSSICLHEASCQPERPVV